VKELVSPPSTRKAPMNRCPGNAVLAGHVDDAVVVAEPVL